jgi:hypothetical protein
MGARDEIVAAVSAWDGVAALTRADGTVELRYGGRELGRVLADGVVLRFHPRLRTMLVETGRAAPHGDDPARVALRVESDEDAAEAVELFRLAHERARVLRASRRVDD